MNLAGTPPFSGFIGKLGLLEAGIADGGWLPVVLVGGGAVTSLLTLLAISRVWNRAFWRPPAQSPEGDTADAPAADAGPEIQPAAVAADAPGAAETDADGAETDGGAGPDPGGSSASSVRGGRQAARQAAWERHAAVATASTPATDGFGDEPEGGRDRPLHPLPRVMVGATAAMVAVTVALTAVAGPLYAVADRAAGDLLDRTPYLSAVFGGEDIE
jgi:multicomponent Na+:H+ antiporter subunit D